MWLVPRHAVRFHYGGIPVDHPVGATAGVDSSMDNACSQDDFQRNLRGKTLRL